MSYHPPADVVITETVVRRLLRQAPAHADMPVRFAAHGWDNEIWRVGDDLALRLPRRSEGEALLRNEVRWLPAIAAQLPVPIPAAIFVGEPDSGFPYIWAMTPWLSGEPASSAAATSRDRYAAQLAAVLRAMHLPAPPGAPVNPVRGGSLSERRPYAAERLAGHPEGRRLLAILDDAVATPPYSGPPLWLHGDPHPYNLLVRDGAISALIDFGDIGSGDPASDLGVAWLHFTAAGRERFFAVYGAGEAAQRRARGWAVCYASFMTRLETTHPLRACGDHAAAELLAE